MTLTNREKALVAFLPAVLVLIPYGFWINAPKQKEVTALERNLANAVKTAPTLQKLNETKYRLAKLQAEILRLETNILKEKKRWESLGAQCSDARLRNRRRVKLTQLLSRHGLDIIEEGPNDSTGADRNLKPSAAMDKLAKQLAESANGRPPQLWRLRLYAEYPEMLRALNELSTGEVIAIPVALTMKEARKNSTLTNGCCWCGFRARSLPLAA